MPQLGLTMESGIVVEWLVGEGDQIVQGQEILSVETDKAIVAVEAHQAGTLVRILVPAGQEVPVGAILAVGLAPGEVLPADWQPTRTQPAGQDRPAEGPGPAVASSSAGKDSAARGDGPLQASWKARTMARAADLDLRSVPGSGPAGRIVAEDVARAAAAAATAGPGPEIRATPVAANLAAALGLDLSRVAGSGSDGQITQSDVIQATAAILKEAARPERPTPEGRALARPPGPPQVTAATALKGVRRIVSEGMAMSAHSTARVTLFREVDASGLLGLRQRFKAQGQPVSYNDLLVYICAAALREHPEANARLGDGQVEQLDRINIGLAADTDRGLLVPVIHHADLLSVPQIAAESATLVQAARAGQLLPDDLSGGTFTITNLGMFGVEGFTPVINLPECCILGVGRIVRKPIVCDDLDTVAVRPMMTISLVFDHRVIDGAPAARFLDRIAQLIEDPLLLLAHNVAR